MSSVTLPVTRNVGRALVIGGAASRAAATEILDRLGFGCAGADDPYAGTAELFLRQTEYQAVILSLQSIYQEELTLIGSIKSRLPWIEVWLTDIEGRQAALAEAMRLGADGLLGDEGLHRIAVSPRRPSAISPQRPAGAAIADRLSSPRGEIGGLNGAGASAGHPVSDVPKAALRSASVRNTPSAERHVDLEEDSDPGEAVLTAEELRALLHDPSPMDDQTA